MAVLTNFIDRILGRTQSSRTTAKDRLRLVLLHDRGDVSRPMLEGPMLEQMRQDLIGVLSKYVEIDQEQLEVNLEREDGAVALIANIPILKVRETPLEPVAEPKVSEPASDGAS